MKAIFERNSLCSPRCQSVLTEEDKQTCYWLIHAKIGGYSCAKLMKRSPNNPICGSPKGCDLREVMLELRHVYSDQQYTVNLGGLILRHTVNALIVNPRCIHMKKNRFFTSILVFET